MTEINLLNYLSGPFKAVMVIVNVHCCIIYVAPLRWKNSSFEIFLGTGDCAGAPWPCDLKICQKTIFLRFVVRRNINYSAMTLTMRHHSCGIILRSQGQPLLPRPFFFFFCFIRNAKRNCVLLKYNYYGFPRGFPQPPRVEGHASNSEALRSLIR